MQVYSNVLPEMGIAGRSRKVKLMFRLKTIDSIHYLQFEINRTDDETSETITMELNRTQLFELFRQTRDF